MENDRVRDTRSGKVIFLTHCILNQNAKVRGIARFPGAISPVVEMLLKAGVGMVQMPCPETAYLGNMRWGQVKDQYDNPMFRRHCQRLCQDVADQAEDYLNCGYQVLGFVMMDGSPCCGLNKTPQPVADGGLWGGMTWYVPRSQGVTDRGVFCEELQACLSQRRGLEHLPFTAFPEADEVGLMDEALLRIRQLIERD